MDEKNERDIETEEVKFSPVGQQKREQAVE